ncbi:MAG: hypothetical protein N4A49_16060 [Marinifilaceae bacterium]|jgi:hypothetical protein|nr:hypothetical protein [Marinifilaceae bacterium]
MYFKNTIYIFLILLVGFSTYTNAQEKRNLKKEIHVKTNYTPKLKKSTRISELPVINDTIREKPKFNYFIRTKAEQFNFAPQAIPFAKLSMRRKFNTYKHALKIEGASYSRLLTDYNFFTYKKDRYNIHINAGYNTFKGKIKIKDDIKTKPNISNFYINANTEFKLNENEYLNLNTAYTNYSLDFYKKSTNNSIANIDDYKSQLINANNQKINDFNLSSSYNKHLDLFNGINIQGKLNYNYFSDKYESSSNLFMLDINANSLKDNNNFYTEISIGSYSAKQKRSEFGSTISKEEDIERKNFIFKLSPYYQTSINDIKLKLGFKLDALSSDNSDFGIFPNIEAIIPIIDDNLCLNLAADGELKLNSIQQMILGNLYASSNILSSPEKVYNLKSKLKGKFSSKTNYQIYADYSIFKNRYFYNLAPNTDITTNYFISMKEDGKLLKLGLYVISEEISKLKLDTKFQINSYSIDNKSEAWNSPKYNLYAGATYKIMQNLNIGASLDLESKKKFLYNNKVEESDAYIGLNFNADYKINKQFNAYAKINNILADKYYKWAEYPGMSINFCLGLNIQF